MHRLILDLSTMTNYKLRPSNIIFTFIVCFYSESVTVGSSVILSDDSDKKYKKSLSTPTIIIIIIIIEGLSLYL